MAKRDRIDTAQMLSEARDDVKHADQKASVLLAALGIGFGAIVGGQVSAGWSPASLSPYGQTTFWIGVAVAVLAVGCCALAVWPRYSLDSDPEYGTTYWGHVAAYKSLSNLESALDAEINSERRTRHQLWRLSRLVLTKYRFIRVAIVAGGLAGATLFIAIVFIN